MIDWFGLEEGLVKDLIHQDFTYLPITENCATATSNENLLTDNDIKLYPNPATAWVEISFNQKQDGWTKLSIFNAEGKELKVVLNKVLNRGDHQFKIDLNGFPSGNYYYRLQMEQQVKTKHFVKI
jgi:hypothetical protein